jgi:hypothetical protein
MAYLLGFDIVSRAPAGHLVSEEVLDVFTSHRQSKYGYCVDIQTPQDALEVLVARQNHFAARQNNRPAKLLFRRTCIKIEYSDGCTVTITNVPKPKKLVVASRSQTDAETVDDEADEAEVTEVTEVADEETETDSDGDATEENREENDTCSFGSSFGSREVILIE